VLLGAGEQLLSGLPELAAKYSCVEQTSSEGALHVVLRKRA
jgi:hypothetical protein